MSAWTKELLREIDGAVQKTFDVGTRDAARKREGSRRDTYEKGLTEVRKVAGLEAARESADWIQGEIRTEERFPSARVVRKRGARICREAGHEVSTGSWLGA